jgi:hypothetical protein
LGEGEKVTDQLCEKAVFLVVWLPTLLTSLAVLAAILL